MSSPSFIQRITVKHPGYGGSNTILALPACDGANEIGQAHYSTVHSACAILANNRKDGWLSPSRSGDPRTCADSAGLMPAGTYFFHIESEPDSDPYPIVPNFRAWAFPHNDLPSLWHESAQSVAAIQPRTATETCRLTNKRLACENAHIIPAAEKSWFADNEMDQYGELGGRTGQDAADSPTNSIRLRRDVHSLWDNLFFSIVPKISQNHESDGTKWYAHSMVQDGELYADYHNRLIEPLADRAVEYLFARFAWDVFPKVIGFLQSTQPRRLAVRQADGEVEVRMFSMQECKSFTLGQGRGRSASPTKRSRGADGAMYELGTTQDGHCERDPKRQRQIPSYEQPVGVDSAVSVVGTSSEPESPLLYNSSRPEVFRHLTGLVDQQECDHDSSSDESAGKMRGRKRRRSLE